MVDKKKELIIQVNKNFMYKDKYDEIGDWFRKQRETGTVIVPPYCTVIAVPDDVQLVFEEEDFEDV